MVKQAQRVVANALVFFDDDWSAPNVGRGDRADLQRIYLKNSYCSLKSAALADPGAQLVLVHHGDILAEFLPQFQDLGVRLEAVPYQRFRVPDRFPWRAGYYKLDALAWLAERYEQVLVLDTDTVVVGQLDDLWADSKDRVLLFETGHRLSHAFRTDINDVGRHFGGASHRAVHWGGELVAGSGDALTHFLAECHGWYLKMASDWSYFDTHKDQGDETILSLAAETLAHLVRPANPYIERYWTNDGFRLVSPNWKYNPVDIWHLPLEKKDGILRLYDELQKRPGLPDRDTLAKWLHVEYSVPKALWMLAKRVKRALV